MAAIPNQSLVLLTCLERFEKQVEVTASRAELVGLFCRQIIPLLSEHNLIDDLREYWLLRRTQINQKIQELEEKALEEVKGTFVQVREAIGNKTDKRILVKLSLINRLILGDEKWYGNPLYRILYSEMKELFEMLIDAGYVDLCKKYAKTRTRAIYIETHPQRVDKSAQMFTETGDAKILEGKETEITSITEQSGLISIPIERHLVDKTYIQEFFFAPIVLEADAARDEVNRDRICDPVIAWWYFDVALRYWNTTEFYFDEIVRPKNGNDHGKHFQTTCEKVAWREISSVKEGDNLDRPAVTFTEGLFRVGLRALINEINIYLSQDPIVFKKQLHSIRTSVTTFELFLDGNELWVNVKFENDAIEKFYIQKFHEGRDLEGSRLYQFMCELLNESSSGGGRPSQKRTWESASKCINRLKLPELLKREFFSRCQGDEFQFRAPLISLKSNSDKDVAQILRQLQENHLKSPKSVQCRAVI